jgi:hypothetical protein
MTNAAFKKGMPFLVEILPMHHRLLLSKQSKLICIESMILNLVCGYCAVHKMDNLNCFFNGVSKVRI